MKQRNSAPRSDKNRRQLEKVLETARSVIEERIRRRSYELFEQRGRQDGHALDDWLQAEAEVLERRMSAA